MTDYLRSPITLLKWHFSVLLFSNRACTRLASVIYAGFLFCSVSSLAATCESPLKIARINKNDGLGYECYTSVLLTLLPQTDCPPQFIDRGFITMARRQKMLEQGDVDVLIGLSKTAEREQFLHFSKAIGTNQLMFFAAANDSRWQAINSICDGTMKKARMLIPAAGYFGAELETIRNAANCVASIDHFGEGLPQAILMLTRARADIIASPSTWWNRLDPSSKAQLNPLKLATMKSAIHVAYRKDRVSLDYVKGMDEQITTYLRNNGSPCGLD